MPHTWRYLSSRGVKGIFSLNSVGQIPGNMQWEWSGASTCRRSDPASARLNAMSVIPATAISWMLSNDTISQSPAARGSSILWICVYFQRCFQPFFFVFLTPVCPVALIEEAKMLVFAHTVTYSFLSSILYVSMTELKVILPIHDMGGYLDHNYKWIMPVSHNSNALLSRY